MKIIINIVLSALAMTILSSCASIAGDNSKMVQVNSTPQGAKVYLNNAPVGTTPTQIAINNTWSPTVITLKKKGYEDSSAEINTAFQTVGLLNIFFWPGFIIDAATGSTMKITPESRAINADLSTVA